MKLRNLLVLVVLIALVSCIPVLTLSDVAKLRKGMTIEEVKSVSEIDPEYELTFNKPELGDIDYKVLVYELSSGAHKSDYLYIFEKNKLLFWGYPQEFAKSNSQLYNKIGKLAVEEIERREPKY